MKYDNVYGFLKRWEGEQLKLYYLNGIPHIGVGHNLKDGPDLSPSASDMILRDDVALFTGQLSQRVAGWTRLSDARRAVLTSIAFQVGIGGLMGFTKMLAAIAAGDWTTASHELLDSTLATQNIERTHNHAVILETNSLEA